MPRIADVLNVRLDVSMDEPTETIVLPPAEQFPQVNLVFEPAVPATAQNHGPTMARPTTGFGGQYTVTAVELGKEPSGCEGAPPIGVSTFVACCDDGTRNTVQTRTKVLTGLDKMMPVERATRRGKTRTGGRRSCTLRVWFLLVAMLLMVDVVGAVFAPADRTALKAAVGTCLSETPDGSCPQFAATNATPGNPYGVIGDWDVSAVTSMYDSKCTLSPSLWPRLPLLCILNIQYTTTRVSSDHNSHTFCSF
jgi:hypothetical protein